MRADRLVALLLLLQRRGTVTAREAAEELEVSTRTARRDFEALSASGVPVYAQPGRGGGWRLLGGGSTDLSGLTSSEARALFVAAGRSLDAHPHLRTALRKLASALPEPFQDDAESAAASIRFDDSTWSESGAPTPPPLLDAITDAVIEGRRLRISYESPRSGPSSREIGPLGLVSKRGTWYLMASTDDGQRTFRVDRIMTAEVLEGSVNHPESFELADEWANVLDNIQDLRLQVKAEALINQSVAWPLRWVFGSGLEILERADSGNQLRVMLASHSAEAMACQVAGFGRAITFIDPPTEVAEQLARVSLELSEMYRPSLTPENL